MNFKYTIKIDDVKIFWKSIYNINLLFILNSCKIFYWSNYYYFECQKVYMKKLYGVLLLATQIMCASGPYSFVVGSVVVELPSIKKNMRQMRQEYKAKHDEFDALDQKIQKDFQEFQKHNKAWADENARKFDPSTTLAHSALEKFQALSPANQIQYAQWYGHNPQGIVTYWFDQIKENQSAFYEKKNAKLSEIVAVRDSLICTDQEQRKIKKEMQKELYDLEQSLDKKKAEGVIGSFVYKNLIQPKKNEKNKIATDLERKQHVRNVIDNASSKHIIEQQRKQQHEKDTEDKMVAVRVQATGVHKDILDFGRKKKEADSQREYKEQAAKKLKLEAARKEAQRKANQDKKNKEVADLNAKKQEQEKKEQERIARQKAQSVAVKEKIEAEKAAAIKKRNDELALLDEAAKTQVACAKMESDLVIKNKNEKAAADLKIAQKKAQPNLAIIDRATGRFINSTLSQEQGLSNVVRAGQSDEKFAKMLTAQIAAMEGQDRGQSIDAIAEQMAARVARENSGAMPSQFNIELQKTIKGICSNALADQLPHYNKAVSSPVIQNVPDAFRELESSLTKLFESSSDTSVTALEDACKRVDSFHELLQRTPNAATLPTYFKNNDRLLNIIVDRVKTMDSKCENHKSLDNYMNEYLQIAEDLEKVRNSVDKVIPALQFLNEGDTKIKSQNHAINDKYHQFESKFEEITEKIGDLAIQDLLKKLQSAIVMNPHEKE